MSAVFTANNYAGILDSPLVRGLNETSGPLGFSSTQSPLLATVHSNLAICLSCVFAY